MPTLFAFLFLVNFSTPTVSLQAETAIHQMKSDSSYLKSLLIYLRSIPDYRETDPFCLITKTKLAERYIWWDLKHDTLSYIAERDPALLTIEGTRIIGPDTNAIYLGDELASIEASIRIPKSPIKDALAVEFWSDKKSKRNFKRDVEAGWDKFYRNRPNSIGIIALSEIVFDAAGQYAAVYVQHSRGGLRGLGALLIIDWHKQEIVRKIELWVS